MISSIFSLSEVLSIVNSERLEHGLLVGIMLVFASAAMSGSKTEILIGLGLVTALVVYVMRERSFSRLMCVPTPAKAAAWKFKAVGLRGVPGRKNTRLVRVPASGLSRLAGRKIIPRLHQAEPKTRPNFADGMPLCEQVDQLLCDLLPGKSDVSVCTELARLVSPCIWKLVPEAQIDVIAQSSVVRIGRTGYRPEVDLLVTVPPKVLAERLLMHMRRNGSDHSVSELPAIMDADENALSNLAISAVSAQLPFCKLWRPASQGLEPKAVLNAPRSLGVLSVDLRINVYVNCPNAIRAHELFNESDIHVQKLIAIVRRWARDRCIALCKNASFGHISLYAWSVLAKYFCQSQEEELQSKKTTVEWFGEFVDFCINRHDSFSQTLIEAALQINGPHDTTCNVVERLTLVGMKRLRKELARAKRLLADGSSLRTILETRDVKSTTAETPC